MSLIKAIEILNKVDLNNVVEGKKVKGVLKVVSMKRNFEAVRMATTYDIYTLSNGDKSIRAVFFDPNYVPSIGEVVKFTGIFTKYKGVLQINIDSMGKTKIEIKNTENLVYERLILRLNKLIDNVDNELVRYILEEETLLNDNFQNSPASIEYHHAYKHGLLEHSIECAEISLSIAKKLSEGKFMSKDLLIAGSLLHDIGKVGNYEAVNQSFKLKLQDIEVDHSINGAIKLRKYRTQQNSPLIELLENVILSHHKHITKEISKELLIISKADQISCINNQIKISPGSDTKSFKIKNISDQLIYSEKYTRDVLKEINSIKDLPTNYVPKD